MKRRHEREEEDDTGKREEEYEEREEEEEEEEEEVEEHKKGGRKSKKSEKATKPPSKKRVTVKEEQSKIQSELQKLISALDGEQAAAIHNEDSTTGNGGSGGSGENASSNPLRIWEGLQDRAIEAKVGPASIKNFEKNVSATDASAIVHINVGGQVSTTMRDTLCKHEGTLLYDIGTDSGAARTMTRDSNGYYFIDRNPMLFEMILDYLRTGVIDIPKNKGDRKKLLLEAEYYRMTPLITTLRGVEIPSTLGLDFDCTRALTEWCHAREFELIYRGTRDGFEAKDFHRCCNGRGPTLFLAKTELGFIFGGYTEIPWNSLDSNKLFEGTGNEFICSLVNPSNTDPLVFPVRRHSKFKCVLHQAKYGPSLGSNQSGFCEIHISDKPDVNPNSHVLGFPSMFDGKGYTNKIFNGTDRFKLMDYEVFQVIKK